MKFSEEETKKLRAMMLFMVEKQHKLSDGKSGFRLNDIQPVLDDLETDKKINKRPTINSHAYFLKTN